MSTAAKPARRRAFPYEREAQDGAIQSTNCAVGVPRNAGGRQSRMASLAEVVTNVAAGFLVSLVGQQVILPIFAIHIGLAAHFGIATLFTLVSLVCSYLVRRLFNSITWRRLTGQRVRLQRRLVERSH